MTVSTFYYLYTSDIDYTVIQRFDWGEERQVPKDYDDLLAWINEGNTPEMKSGSPYVSISGGKITFDSAGALEAQKEQQRQGLSWEYEKPFSDLSKAYMAALILGDTETMTTNRTAYQALLDEYNKKLEEIG